MENQSEKEQQGDGFKNGDFPVDPGNLIDLDSEKKKRNLDAFLNKWYLSAKAILGIALSIFLGGLIIYFRQ